MPSRTTHPDPRPSRVSIVLHDGRIVDPTHRADSPSPIQTSHVDATDGLAVPKPTRPTSMTSSNASNIERSTSPPFFQAAPTHRDQADSERRRTRFESDSFSLPRPPSGFWENGDYPEDEEPDEEHGVGRGLPRVTPPPENVPGRQSPLTVLATPPRPLSPTQRTPLLSRGPPAINININVESEFDNESTSDSSSDESSAPLPTFMRPRRRQSASDPSRRNTWHPFNFTRRANTSPFVPTRASFTPDYGSIDDPLASPPPSRMHPSWRKSFILSKRKSGVYDEIMERDPNVHGMRVWYEDYTTIDWIHDNVKERVRLRTLRRMPGLKGWIETRLDAMQAWVLLALIGIACGCLASGIQTAYNYLGGLRTGYCTESFWMSRDRCCRKAEEYCASWTDWSHHNTIHSQLSYTIYVFSGVFLAALSTLLVQLSKTSPKRHRKKEPAWVTNARAQRGLRRSKDSIDHLVKFHASGSGIPEVKTILGGFVIRGFLGVRTLWVKTVALILSVSSGLTIGVQGPLVHIACCVGNVLSRMFNKYATNEGKRREILSASSAAGVAVAFGAPLGGVLFALEEVSYYFPLKTMWRSFFCALVAAGTVRVINPLGGGKIVLFQVHWEGADTWGGVWGVWEVMFFAFIGVLGGLYGALFIRLTSLYARFRARTFLQRYPSVEVILVALFTGLIAYMFDLTRMGNTELVAELFAQCSPNSTSPLCVHASVGSALKLLLTTLLVKLVLTVVTFGIKVPAGIFIPSMVVGALIGRSVGVVVQWAASAGHILHCSPASEASTACVVPGVYAVVGAASAITGVTRMTVSLTVIILELTGSLPSLLPTMLAIMASKWVADALAPLDLYSLVIQTNDYPYLDAKRGPRTDHAGSTTTGGTIITTIDGREKCVGEVCRRPHPVECGRIYTLREIETWLESGEEGWAIVDARPPNEGVLVGYVAAGELRFAVGQVNQNGGSGVVFHRPKLPASVRYPGTTTSPASSPLPTPPDSASSSSSSGSEYTTPETGETQRGIGMSGIVISGSSSSSGISGGISGGGGLGSSGASLAASPINDPPPSSLTPPSNDDPRIHDLAPYTDQAPLSIPATMSLDVVHELFVKLGVRCLCVVWEGKLVGVVGRKDVVGWGRKRR
ncbi:chloride channel [Gaertneriomyces semiglobifer]|nr:chloride channel [Gaertneriomyces semiglobifer]